MTTHSNNHYYVPHGALYPVTLSAGLLTLASGFIFSVATDKNKDLAYLQTPGKWMMYIGAAIILLMTFKWLSAVVVESVTGQYKKWEDKSFRIGMIVFICSEVAFFCRILWRAILYAHYFGTRPCSVRPHIHPV